MIINKELIALFNSTSKGCLLTQCNQRQLKFLGHVVRKGLENLTPIQKGKGSCNVLYKFD